MTISLWRLNGERAVRWYLVVDSLTVDALALDQRQPASAGLGCDPIEQSETLHKSLKVSSLGRWLAANSSPVQTWLSSRRDPRAARAPQTLSKLQIRCHWAR